MAQGDTKLAVAYQENAGDGAYNNSTDTFSWVLVTNQYSTIDANAATLALADLTGATVGGNYAGKTALTTVTWSKAANVVTFDADNVTFAANAGNPIDARCLVVVNDTSATDDVVQIFDLTTDGTTAVDLTNGFTFNFNASGAYQVTVN